jgi:4'-phosphopantetheinyl transferase EntD
MMRPLLPMAAILVEANADNPSEPVFPGEEDVIANAVEQRRREFITARRCAREALARLGYPAAPIRPGPKREPMWPAGIVGSITHCTGYRAAVVAEEAGVDSVGIDAEPHACLPDGILDTVTAPGESAGLAALFRSQPWIHWDRLLFSAKESVYKAWYPLTRRWLGFEDAVLTFDPAASTFVAKLRVDGTRVDGGPALTELRGRYSVARGLIVTAVSVVPRLALAKRARQAVPVAGLARLAA